MKSILITGGSGFLGGNLLHFAFDKWKTYSTFFSTPTNKDCEFHMDIRNKIEVDRIIHQLKPDVIIHTAAISNFNYCANHDKIAWEVNVEGTRNIINAAQSIKSKVIYISTDLVFKGDRSFYSENDIPDPQSVYGKTKQEGEKLVALLSDNYIIIRTSVIYNWSFNLAICFTQQIINLLKSNEIVNLLIDEYRNPIYGANLCKIILNLARSDIKKEIFHICGNERISRYELGIKICKIFGFSKNCLMPITFDEINFEDERPKDCSMDNRKLKNFMKIDICSIDEGLSEMKKHYYKYYHKL